MARMHVNPTRHRRELARALLAIVPALIVLGSLNAGLLDAPAGPQVACAANDNVGGFVYQDYNANGVRDRSTPDDRGLGGVGATAYSPSGAAIATTLTEADGSYVLAVPNGTDVRIEFTDFPPGFLSGPFGRDSATTVTFVKSPNCAVSLGLNVPSAYCQDNPDIAVNCYIFGDQFAVVSPTLVTFPYSAGGNSLPEIDNPPIHPVEAASNQIGTTWGLAYQQASDSLFAAAFMKRHSGFGLGGPGAIYRIDRASGAVSTFVTLNAGPDPHPPNDTSCPNGSLCFAIDQFSWDPVGKRALGDIDMGDDDRTLWAINLFDRQLYEIPIGIPPTPPAASSIISFPFASTGGDLTDLPGLQACPNPDVDIRPFGLGVHNGRVYVGMVCTAESTVPPGFSGGVIPIGSSPGDPSRMRAYVYAFDPANDTFTPALNFPLNYARRCAVRRSSGACSSALWHPWVPVFTLVESVFRNEYMYPQPWLTDIEFDGEDMILGFRDRFGDQVGFLQRSTNRPDRTLYTGDAAGDVLRACSNGAGGWVLEDNGLCGGVGPGLSPGGGTGPGTPGGEFYYQEYSTLHDELSMAGLAQIPGYPDVLETMYDPIISGQEAFDGGVLWSNNNDGSRTKTHRIFDTDDLDPLTFGKAGGLGDLEAMCLAAPLEIGNRVWRDKSETTRNGIQDATIIVSATEAEIPIPNVTVHLYLSDTLIATDITDAAGEYIFNASNVPGGIRPFTTYVVRMDNPVDYALNGSLFGLTLTLSNQGSNDAIDNDGLLAPDGYPQIVAATRGPGDNDHTFDFGFYDIVPPTAVELLYFRVENVSGRQVTLGWATEIEIDNFGFNLYRAPEDDFARASLVHFEPSATGGGGGAMYDYIDTAPSGGVWWYWLADVDTQGRETRHGPVSALVEPGVTLSFHVHLPIVHQVSAYP